MNKVLVILSGGQDSTTCLAWARFNGYEVHAITFDYNQRHRREIEAARHVGLLAKVASHEVLKLGPDLLKGTSPLTDPSQALETYENHDQMEQVIGDRVEKTFVPMRNALFLTIAANRAACLGAVHLVTGVCEADNANYPDCRSSFVSSQEDTINLALGMDQAAVTIMTPLLHTSKKESIQLMERIGCLEWLAFTHTAYDGNYPPTGKDHASVLRAHGFEEACLPDPLVVRAWMAGLMDLPPTQNYLDIDRCNDMREKITQLQQTIFQRASFLRKTGHHGGQEFA